LKHFSKFRFFYILTFLWILIGIAGIFLTEKPDFNIFWNAYKSPFLNSFFIFFTHLSDWQGLIFFGLLIFILKRNPYFLGWYIFTILLSSLLLFLTKQYIFANFDRPFYLFAEHITAVPGVENKIHFSFPSGHTTTAFAIFALLSVAFKKPFWQVLFFLTAFLVAISRVYLGQHFLQDIVAGSFYGCAIFWLSSILFLQLTKKTSFSRENIFP